MNNQENNDLYNIDNIPTRTQLHSKNKKNQKYEDDYDDTFAAIKRRPRIGLIFLILLLLGIIGTSIYYYFIIDSPKTIYETIINNTIKNANSHEDKLNIDFQLNLNMTSSNDKYKELTPIINELKLFGTTGRDINKNIASANLITQYKNKELLNITSYMNNSDPNNGYLILNNLLDKVIKIPLTENNQTNSNTITKNDYNNIINILKEALNDTLNKANYQKEITKYNKEYVKKITLKIDKSFKENLYDYLLHNEQFIDSYSKISNITKEQLSDNLNKSISELKDTTETIDLYLSILENKFISLEITTELDNLKIIKEDNTYKYEYSSSYTLKYQGYIKIKKIDTDYLVTINLDLLEEKTTIDIFLDYTINNYKDINSIDTSNSTDINSLSESDQNKILENLVTNDAFNALIEDLNLKESIYGTNSDI